MSKCKVCRGSGYSREVQRLVDKHDGVAPFDPGERGSRAWEITDPAVVRFAAWRALRHPGFRDSLEEAERVYAEIVVEESNKASRFHLSEYEANALVESRVPLWNHDGPDGCELWWPNPQKDVPKPTLEEVREWSVGGFGHYDSIQWVVINAQAQRLGVATDCPECGKYLTLRIRQEL